MVLSPNGRFLSIVAVVGVSLAVAGCGPTADTAGRYPLTGTVTWDGQPVAEGSIVFLPTDGKGGRPDGGSIKNGRYELKAIAGPKRVEINAVREIPGQFVNSVVEPGKKVLARESYIPPRYNSKSELKAEVKAEGENVFDFSLKPSPSK